MREEIWKDIEGWEGKYQVSNMGNVKSLERTVWNGRGYFKTSERILKPGKDRDGYLIVQLSKEGKVKACKVHRLVSQAFIPNPDNLPQVNHIDENKENNHVDNLEWVTCRENANHGTRNQRVAEKESKPIIGIDKVTGLIVEFQSAREAERQLGINNSSIIKCCKGKRYKSCGGFQWYYKDADTEE